MNILRPIIISLAAVTFAGCGEKKQSDVIIMEKVDTPKPSVPVKMNEYHDSDVISWLGNKYTYDIRRTPCDSLPRVKDEDGQKYTDNSVTLTISRSDGSVFMKKTFTKRFFESSLTSEMSLKGILDGFVFHEVDGNVLQFAASVAYPQSDENIPILMRIDRMGNITFKRGIE